MISKKKQRKAMGVYGHLGNPSVATKGLGELLNADTFDFLFEAVSCFVRREAYEIFTHHFLYHLRFLHIGIIPGHLQMKEYVYSNQLVCTGTVYEVYNNDMSVDHFYEIL